MDDETKYRDADARIGHIKRGPGMSERDVKIEEEEIDHPRVHETVGQISEDAGEQKPERNVAPEIRPPPSQQKPENKKKRGTGEQYEK